MRLPAFIPGFKNSQQIRIIINKVGIYTTIKDIFYDLFAKRSHADAIVVTLKALANVRSDAKKIGDPIPVGLTYYAFGHHVQVDLL
jgi:hypothetical protein